MQSNAYTVKYLRAGMLLRLTQCFPLKEGRVCIHVARKANGVDVWLRKNLKRILVNHHNLIL